MSGLVRRLIIGAIAVGLLAVPASAVGAKKDIYVVDIARGDNGHLFKINPKTRAKTEIGLNSTDPLFDGMRVPTGIVVDKQGFLIIAVQDGYDTHYTFDDHDFHYDCNNTGCGAILRVDPATGATEVISVGDRMSNPTGVLLPPDGDINDDNGGPEDQLLVTDSGNWHIVAVDTGPGANPNDNQTYYYDNRPHTAPAFNPDDKGFRGPWDIARDKNGDLWITNIGSQFNDLAGVPGCDDGNPANGPGTVHGYVIRMSGGQIAQYYCDPDFRAPRGIVLTKKRTAYVTDPQVVNVSSAGEKYAGLFSIAGGQVSMLSLADQFRTPSGISFNYEGTDLLVADESVGSPCSGQTGGCGGVLGVTLGGTQSIFTQGAPFRDPMDVAVDRRGAPDPVPKPKPQGHDCKPKKCEPKPKLNSRFVHDFNERGKHVYNDSGGQTLGLRSLRLRGFEQKVKLNVICVRTSQCPAAHVRPADDGVRDARDIEFDGSGVLGRFQVVAYVPDGKQPKKESYLGRWREFKLEGGQLTEVQTLAFGKRKRCLEASAKTVQRHTVGCGEG